MRRSVAIRSISAQRIGAWATYTRIRTAKTGGSALEVGEAARWARPIAWARTVFARWERLKDLGRAIQHAVR